MFHTIPLFRTLCVVPAVGGANEVTSDPANPLEWNGYEGIGEIDVIAIYFNIEGSQFLAWILLLNVVNICVDFVLI